VREHIGQMDPVKIDTELGSILVAPKGLRGVSVNAPHLTVDGMPLQASAFLVSDNGLKWSFLQQFDSSTEILSLAPHALQARLVDGRSADVIMLGKIGAAIQPAIERLAEANPEIFFEAERRALNNEILALEREIAKQREKLAKKVQELAAIEVKLLTKP
jgi:hypothetical protein